MAISMRNYFVIHINEGHLEKKLNELWNEGWDLHTIQFPEQEGYTFCRCVFVARRTDI